MMDEKKVREAIYCMKVLADEAVCEECNHYENCDHTRQAENAKIAIEALEKQLPKKGKENGMYSGVFKKIKAYTCPTCGNCCLEKMMNERQNTEFCWDCGQKLDWSE